MRPGRLRTVRTRRCVISVRFPVPPLGTDITGEARFVEGASHDEVADPGAVGPERRFRPGGRVGPDAGDASLRRSRQGLVCR